MLEYLFNKVADLSNFIKNKLQHKRFPMKFSKFLTARFLQNTSGGCFWQWELHIWYSYRLHFLLKKFTRNFCLNFKKGFLETHTFAECFLMVAFSKSENLHVSIFERKKEKRMTIKIFRFCYFGQ